MKLLDEKFGKIKKKRFLSVAAFTPLQTIGGQKRVLMSVTGFTLMELMFAVAILVTALLGILLTYLTCFELISTAHNLTLATNAVQGKIEEIRDYNFYDIYSDYDGQTFPVNEIAVGNSLGVVYVDNTDPDLLEITVSICWRQRGNRIIGEDLDLDGVLDPGEDLNGNGIIDSPAQLVTLITAR